MEIKHTHKRNPKNWNGTVSANLTSININVSPLKEKIVHSVNPASRKAWFRNLESDKGFTDKTKTNRE